MPKKASDPKADEPEEPDTGSLPGWARIAAPFAIAAIGLGVVAAISWFATTWRDGTPTFLLFLVGLVTLIVLLAVSRLLRLEELSTVTSVVLVFAGTLIIGLNVPDSVARRQAKDVADAAVTAAAATLDSGATQCGPPTVDVSGIDSLISVDLVCVGTGDDPTVGFYEGENGFGVLVVPAGAEPTFVGQTGCARDVTSQVWTARPRDDDGECGDGAVSLAPA